MPQLEQIDTFLGQIIWLAITFGVLYLILWRAALPRIADVLQKRQERIDDDLQKAEELKQEARAVLESYESEVAKARVEVLGILRESADRFAQDAAERREKHARRIADETLAAEARIETMRQEALANVRSLSNDVAQAAIRRLVDIEVTPANSDAAVAAVLQERR